MRRDILQAGVQAVVEAVAYELEFDAGPAGLLTHRALADMDVCRTRNETSLFGIRKIPPHPGDQRSCSKGQHGKCRPERSQSLARQAGKKRRNGLPDTLVTRSPGDSQELSGSPVVASRHSFPCAGHRFEGSPVTGGATCCRHGDSKFLSRAGLAPPASPERRFLGVPSGEPRSFRYAPTTTRWRPSLFQTVGPAPQPFDEGQSPAGAAVSRAGIWPASAAVNEVAVSAAAIPVSRLSHVPGPRRQDGDRRRLTRRHKSAGPVHRTSLGRDGVWPG